MYWTRMAKQNNNNKPTIYLPKKNRVHINEKHVEITIR